MLGRVLADNGSMMTVAITEKEKDIARKVKEDFSEALHSLVGSIDTVADLRDAVVSQAPTAEDIKDDYKLKFKQYKAVIMESFNKSLVKMKSSLELMAGILDPDMMRLREIIIAEVSELSDGAEAIMDALDESDKDDFIKKIEYVTNQMEKRERSVTEAIESQLFGHIDHNILGRMKISEVRYRIMKRSFMMDDLCTDGVLNGNY